MPEDALLKTIQWWGNQGSAGGRIVPVASAYAFHHTKGLRVEGLPLNPSSLGYILRLLHQASTDPRTAVEHLALVRCDLGMRSNNTNNNGFNNEGDDSTLQALIHLLRQAPPLKSLDLSCNALDNNAFASIAAVLPGRHPVLREIVLEDNAIKGRRGGMLIRHLLEQSSNLTALNIAENALETAGALELARGLHEYRKLQRLNLSCCQIGDEIVVETQHRRRGHQQHQQQRRCIFHILAESFVKNPLVELHWSAGEIDFVEDDDMDNLPDVEQQQQQRQQQQQQQRSRSPEEIAAAADLPLSICEKASLAVAHLLEHHPCLEVFSVVQSPDFWSPSQNPMVQERLLQAFSRNRTVKHLTLEGCGIHNDTVAALCKVLENNHVNDDGETDDNNSNNALQHLSLLANDLGDKGHEIFCASMANWHGLQKLSSEGATLMLGDQQSQMFLRALPKNTSLTHIRIMDAPLQVMQELDRVGLRNTLLKKSMALLEDYEKQQQQQGTTTAMTSTSMNNSNKRKRSPTANDGLWAPVLSKLARSDLRIGASGIYQILLRALCVPSLHSSTNKDEPRKRARRRHSEYC